MDGLVFTQVYPVIAGASDKFHRVRNNMQKYLRQSPNGIFRVIDREGNFYIVDAAVFERLMQRLEDYEGDLAKILDDA